MQHFFTHHGLPLLFVVVMLESFGIPLPGRGRRSSSSGYSPRRGNYNITVVIVGRGGGRRSSATNLGYWLIGRLGGRAASSRRAPLG